MKQIELLESLLDAFNDSTNRKMDAFKDKIDEDDVLYFNKLKYFYKSLYYLTSKERNYIFRASIKDLIFYLKEKNIK